MKVHFLILYNIVHLLLLNVSPLGKHAQAIYRDFLSCKNCKFSVFFFCIFLIFAQNIDCGYT